MANQSSRSGLVGSTSAEGKKEWTGLRWANVYLSLQQKEAAALFAADPDSVDSFVATLLSDGYNISFAFNEKTDSFVCTVIGKTCKAEDIGWGMSSHAGTWFGALARTLFKLFVLREGMTFQEMGETYSTPLT